jgi:hypothetical protein
LSNLSNSEKKNIFSKNGSQPQSTYLLSLPLNEDFQTKDNHFKNGLHPQALYMDGRQNLSQWKTASNLQSSVPVCFEF